MKKVYLVYENQRRTRGGYWYLVKIFKTELKTKNYIKKQTKNDYCIEEGELDD